MKLDDHPVKERNQISCRIIDKKVILINSEKMESYVLKNIAHDIWKLINSRRSVEELISYCTAKKIGKKKEILETIEELNKLKLIQLEQKNANRQKRRNN